MKTALFLYVYLLAVAINTHVQSTEQSSVGNFVIVEERVKTASSTEYRSSVVVSPNDTVRPTQRVIQAEPTWPEPEPVDGLEPGSYYIFSGYPRHAAKPVSRQPWLGPDVKPNRDH